MTDIRDLTLRDLILTLKGERTYSDLEQASGGIVKAQRWNQITNGFRVNEFPTPRTIEAMANTLNVNVEVVIMAFAREVGLDVQNNRSIFADLLPPMVTDLTDDQRSALLAVIRSMASANESASGDDKKPVKPPKTQPQKKTGGRKKSTPRLRDIKQPRTDLPPMT
ncbi:hypothetical protein B5566_02715 [Mycobacterium sp. MHSD3]|nr:hypothetical protein B5566_02715 [Mycobacterium sp. MHSD3]